MKKRLLSLFLAFLMVVAVVPMSVLPVFAADGEGAETETVTLTTKDYASLYVEGAMALLLSYNTTGDTLSLSAGGGKWADALTGTEYTLYMEGNQQTFTGLDGKTYTSGWTKNADGSVGYELSVSLLKAATNEHWIDLPAALMGGADNFNNTVELVYSHNPYVINDDMKATTDYKDNDDSGTLTEGDVITYNKHMVALNRITSLYINETVPSWAVGMTRLSTKSVYANYDADGRWNGGIQVTKDEGLKKDYDQKVLRYVMAESDAGDGLSTLNVRFRTDADTDAWAVFDNKTVTQVTSTVTNMRIAENVPANIYAIRIYTKTLNSAELLQNNFADLCAFYGADISGLLALSDDDRATVIAKLGAAAKDLTFENSSKSMLDEMIGDALAQITAQKKTRELASLYVSGASVILVAYNAESDGTVTLGSNGTGTWKNLVNDDLYTLDGAKLEYKVNGEPVQTGWTVNEDGSVGYRMDFATAKVAGNNYNDANTHNLQIPISVYEGKDSSTVEIVSKPYTLDIADGSTYTEGDKLYVNVNHLSTRYYVALNVFEAVYTAGLQKVGTKGIYAKYNDTANWNGSGTPANIFDNWHANYKNAENQKALHFVVTEEPSTTAGKVNFWGTFYEGMNSISLSKGNAAATAPTVTATKDTVIHNNTPGAIYAVRVYTRVLNTAELQQNHFVDLVAYTGYAIDVDRFAALPEEAKQIAYTAMKSVTFENATEDAVAAAVEQAYLVGEAISFDGVAVNTNAESSNALRTVYNVNLASIDALEAQGATVEYGALLGVASHGGQSHLTVEDLVLGADGVIRVAVYSNAEDTDASFTYVKYDDQDEMFAQYALAVDYNDAETARSSVDYATTFVYRGYLKVTDKNGTETVVYYADPGNRLYDGVSIDNKELVSLLPPEKAEKITSAQ